MIRDSLIIIDVDQTIIAHNDNLLPGVKDKIIHLFEHNRLWCWSHGGKDYALKVLKRHGLNGFFDKILDKPFYYIDDIKEAGMIRLEWSEINENQL